VWQPLQPRRFADFSAGSRRKEAVISQAGGDVVRMRRKGPAAAAGEDDARGLGFPSKAPYEGGAGNGPAGYRQITSKYGHPGAWFQTPHEGHGHFETASKFAMVPCVSPVLAHCGRHPLALCVETSKIEQAASVCKQLPCPGREVL
jgi:hypothetical protein